MIKKFIMFLLVFYTNIQVFAAEYVPSDILPSNNGGNINSAVSVTSLDGLFSFAKDTIFGLLGLVVVGVFIFIGSRLVVARGNPEEFKKALLQLVYAVVGLFIVSIAYLAVQLVSGLNLN